MNKKKRREMMPDNDKIDEYFEYQNKEKNPIAITLHSVVFKKHFLDYLSGDSVDIVCLDYISDSITVLVDWTHDDPVYYSDVIRLFSKQ